jgi:uncharacterized phage protein (TIGR02218 family)
MKTSLIGAPGMDPGLVAELYTITFANGSILYYTTADINIVYSGNTYVSGHLLFDRSTITTSVGVSVDSVTVTIYESVISNLGLSILANNGLFDGAWVKILRARQSYTVHLFEGMVSDVSADRTKTVLTLSSGNLLLDIEMPRNSYAPGCINMLFDSGCGLVKSAFAHASAVASGSSDTLLVCGLAQANDYYDLGTITFTSGINVGAIRTIKNYTVGHIYLAYPLANAPAISDTFTAYPGCDKRRATCVALGNEAKYRGFPYIPVPEASI